MQNLLVGTNKGRVVDDGVSDDALTIFKVHEELSCCLTDVAALALAHREKICGVELAVFATAQVVTNSVFESELIVVSGHVERGEVSPLQNHVADRLLRWETRSDQSFLAEDFVDFVRVSNWTEALLSVFGNREELDVTTNFRATNFSDAVSFQKLLNEVVANVSNRATVCTAFRHLFFVHFDVVQITMHLHHVVADVWMFVAEFVKFLAINRFYVFVM